MLTFNQSSCALGYTMRLINVSKSVTW